MSIEEIYNYRKVDERFITAGQPTELQLRSAAAEGIEAVVNLAPLTPDRQIADESGLVRELGMEYHHIPVDWEHPTAADFESFETVMGIIGTKRLLIHCAANYRVTTFFALYALGHLGWSEKEADEFRGSIWKGSHYPVWEEFYADMKRGNPGQNKGV